MEVGGILEDGLLMGKCHRSIEVGKVAKEIDEIWESKLNDLIEVCLR